jgi:prepilin-type N-terminal cleavage/methylation domain-containing protein
MVGRHPKYTGMTLIEVLVTMVILALFLTMGVPGYIRATREREVERTALQIKDAINEARQLAMAPINDTGSEVQYYCFNVLASGRWYVNEFTTAPGTVDPSVIACGNYTGSNIDRSGQVPNNIVLQTGNPSWSAFLTHRFTNAIGGGIGEMYTNPANSELAIKVVRTGLTDYSKTVTVNSEGVVNVQ